MRVVKKKKRPWRPPHLRARRYHLVPRACPAALLAEPLPAAGDADGGADGCARTGASASYSIVVASLGSATGVIADYWVLAGTHKALKGT